MSAVWSSSLGRLTFAPGALIRCSSISVLPRVTAQCCGAARRAARGEGAGRRGSSARARGRASRAHHGRVAEDIHLVDVHHAEVAAPEDAPHHEAVVVLHGREEARQRVHDGGVHAAGAHGALRVGARHPAESKTQKQCGTLPQKKREKVFRRVRHCADAAARTARLPPPRPPRGSRPAPPRPRPLALSLSAGAQRLVRRAACACRAIRAAGRFVVVLVPAGFWLSGPMARHFFKHCGAAREPALCTASSSATLLLGYGVDHADLREGASLPPRQRATRAVPPAIRPPATVRWAVRPGRARHGDAAQAPWRGGKGLARARDLRGQGRRDSRGRGTEDRGRRASGAGRIWERRCVRARAHATRAGASHCH